MCLIQPSPIGLGLYVKAYLVNFAGGDVVFIGAVGIFLQTKDTKESHDLDFAAAKELSSDFLDSKQYFVRRVGGKDHSARIQGRHIHKRRQWNTC